MKTKQSLWLLFALVIFASCDSNKGKVEEMTKQFMAAVNGNDKASIYNIYPDAKEVSNMKLPQSIAEGEISVEKNDSGKYIASIANARQQKFVFEVKGENEIVIEDSYSLLDMDSAAMELSIKTGIPMKKLSDRTLSGLINEEGKFVKYLERIYSKDISGGLVYEEGYYTWNTAYGGSVSVTQPIRNTSDVAIKGSEYNVEFLFYSPNGISSVRKTIVEPGQDLEPNEATTLYVYPGTGSLSACENKDFGWNITFVYKNRQPIRTLLKYVKFSGDEYNKYTEEIAKSKDNSNSNDLYAIVSERKLTEDDIKDLSKEELSILRNTIYAKHGYIFKKKELVDHFNSQDWYKGTTTDMNKVSSEFNDSEKYNVTFIKQHE